MLQQTINGLALGSVYALVSLGYALAFGVLRIVNLAYGETMMVGSFSGFWVTQRFTPNILLAIAGGIVGAVVAGLAIHLLAVRPLGPVADLRSSAHLAPLITTLGAAIFLQNITLKLFGAQELAYPRLLSTHYVQVGPFSLSITQGVILVTTAVLLAGLWYLLGYRRWGLAVRATAERSDIAETLGIPVSRIRIETVILASALAGIAGVLVGVLDRGISPMLGVNYGLKGLCALIVGGLESVSGAVIAAMALGIMEVFAVAYLSDTYRDAIAFGALLLTVLVRPYGIFGRQSARY
jgi:branched-chain amino acid transport system permease protein